MDTNGYNPSVFQTGFCFICGRSGDLARHEIFGGPFRRKSKAFGLWVTLCPDCHMNVHKNPDAYRWLKADAERKALELWDWKKEDFINAFGRNYLED